MREYKQNALWIVEFGEEHWYPDAVDQDAVIEACKAAAIVHDCTVLAIFVTPDPLFPMYTQNNKRHRVYECHLSKPELLDVAAQFSVNVDTSKFTNADEKMQRAMLRQARDRINEYANGVAGRYVIALGATGRVLESGRV